MQRTDPNFRTNRGPSNVQPPVRPPSRPVAPAGADRRATDDRSQATSKRSTRQGPRILTSRWFTWAAGASAVGLAFVAALWLTTPRQLPPGVATLTGAAVSDATSLMGAVQTAGLRGAPELKGAIEEIKRLDRERVMIRGWAVDTADPGAALTVIAFAGGTHVLTATTDRSRMDVAQMLGLSDAAAANASFNGTLACRQREPIVVVAIASDRRYSQFRSLVCP